MARFILALLAVVAATLFSMVSAAPQFARGPYPTPTGNPLLPYPTGGFPAPFPQQNGTHHHHHHHHPHPTGSGAPYPTGGFRVPPMSPIKGFLP